MFSFLLVLFFSVHGKASDICDVKDFGANGDGVTLNTQAIQRAVDSCSKNRGTVILHDGVFLSGMIRITKSVEVKIEPTAVLKGTQNINDFPDIVPTTQNTQWGSCRKAFLFINTADDVHIYGGGTLDGSGINPQWTGKEFTRPMALFAALSKNIVIENIQVKDSAMWTVVIFETDNVQVRGLNIDSQYGNNRDGIDVVDSHGVLIEGNTILSEDDSICLKTGSARGVSDVIVRGNHILQSIKANGMKMGTASTGFFKRILFENNKVEKVRKAAMAVESVDGGDIEDVQFRNIDFEAGSAIFLILGRRDNVQNPGSIHNVVFDHIHGTTTNSWGSAITGSTVDGKTYAPTDLVFSNMAIKSQSPSFTGGDNPPEYQGEYPDPDLWKNLPAFGLYLRHLRSVSVSNTAFTAPFLERRKDVVKVDVE